MSSVKNDDKYFNSNPQKELTHHILREKTEHKTKETTKVVKNKDLKTTG